MSNSRLRPADPERRSFCPPHCPNRHCRFYQTRAGWKPPRDGFFTRPSDGRRFQRFRCPNCGRRFSARTFAADYWLRRRTLFPRIAQLASEGPGIRQTARLLDLSHATVVRHLARAGRHSLLFHRQMVRGRPVREPLVLDGFESFEFSQYFPFHLNLAVGAQSWFLHHFTDSPLRRKGSMTAEQQRRRSELEASLGRPHPKAIELGIAELVRVSGRYRRERAQRGHLRRWPDGEDPLVLHSDDHPAYRRAVRRLRSEWPQRRIRQVITSSQERRTTSNPLFPVNLADLLLRHGQANHRRETIAFSKRRQGAVERLAVFTVWRNAIKWRREKRPGETAAMAAGMLDRPLSWAEVFRRRRFPRRALLPESWWGYYWRRVKTLALGAGQTEHNPKYAF